MVSFTSQSLFLMKAAAFVVVSIGMQTAYFAIGRTRHFLHWLLYVLFLGAALLLPSDSERPAAVTVPRTVLILASVSRFLAAGKPWLCLSIQPSTCWHSQSCRRCRHGGPMGMP